jgi:hypothetical protein
MSSTAITVKLMLFRLLADVICISLLHCIVVLQPSLLPAVLGALTALLIGAFVLSRHGRTLPKEHECISYQVLCDHEGQPTEQALVRAVRYWRAMLLVSTALCILAVDFPCLSPFCLKRRASSVVGQKKE